MLMKKKKLFLIVTVILVLSFALTGCSLFTVNEERDYKQTVATLNVNDVEVKITKGQLNESFVQNYQTYSQYGLKAEEVLNLSLVNLAKREVLLVMAKSAFGNSKSSAYDLLTANEQAWVMKTTNKMFSDNWDSSVKKKAKDEYNSNKNIDKEEEEPLYTARNEYTEPAEDTEYKSYEKYLLEEDFFKQKENATGIEKEAIDEIKEDLEKQYKDFGYYREKNAEARLLANYQEKHKGADIEITEEQLEKEYNFVVSANKDKYLKGSTYATDIESDTGAILYHKGQYFKVKSILLQFSTDQDKVYKNWAAQYPADENKEFIEKYRKALVLGSLDTNSANQTLLDEMTDKFMFKQGSFDKGLLVNISNLNYKANNYCTDKECACHTNDKYHEQLKKDIKDKKLVWGETSNLDKPVCDCPQCEFNAYVAYNVPYTQVLNMIADDLAKVEKSAGEEYDAKYPIVAPKTNDSARVAGKKMYIAEKKLEVFDKWIYRVNDDPGMMEGKEYLITPAGQESSYVSEYTALARAIINEQGATKGSTNTSVLSYEIGDKSVEIMTQTNEGNSISYIINDYGVHIIMISTLPLDFNLNENNITKSNDKNPDFDINDYSLGEDASAKKTELEKANAIYVLNSNAFVSFDEETGKALTYNEVKKKTYIENAKTETYGKYERDLFKSLGKTEEFFTKELKKGVELTADGTKYTVKIEKNNSVYKSLLKAAKEIDKANAKQSA